MAVNIVFFENFWLNLTVFTQVLITHKALQAKHLVEYICIYIYIIMKYIYIYIYIYINFKLQIGS